MTTKYNEQALESLIEKYLTGYTLEVLNYKSLSVGSLYESEEHYLSCKGYYKSKYFNNQDNYTRDIAYNKILDQVALQMRKVQLDFAKLWLDDHFKQDFKSSTQRAIGR